MSEYERFLALAQARRSVRHFAERDVSKEDILRVLEAARWAPSNHNRQPWRFVILQDRIRVNRLAEVVRVGITERLKSLPEVAAGYSSEFVQYATFFSGAPVLIAVFHKKPVSFSARLLAGVEHPELVSGEPLSTAMAVQNLLLAAHALGLGTCVMTAPLLAADVLRLELNPPPGHELNCLVAMGYADDKPTAPRRKSVEQITEFSEDGGRVK